MMKAVIDNCYREIGRLRTEVKLAEERHRLEQRAIEELRSEKERLEVRIGELEAALDWMQTYITNQPFDSLAKFWITKKIADALKGGDADDAG